MRGNGDPNPTLTAVIGIVGALLLFVLLVAIQAWFHVAERRELARKAGLGPTAEIGQVPAGTAEALGSYRFIDQQKGIVGIPIERAMALVVQEQGTPAVRR